MPISNFRPRHGEDHYAIQADGSKQRGSGKRYREPSEKSVHGLRLVDLHVACLQV